MKLLGGDGQGKAWRQKPQTFLYLYTDKTQTVFPTCYWLCFWEFVLSIEITNTIQCFQGERMFFSCLIAWVVPTSRFFSVREVYELVQSQRHPLHSKCLMQPSVHLPNHFCYFFSSLNHSVSITHIWLSITIPKLFNKHWIGDRVWEGLRGSLFICSEMGWGSPLTSKAIIGDAVERDPTSPPLHAFVSPSWGLNCADYIWASRKPLCPLPWLLLCPLL